MVETYYEVLDVPRDATIEEIREAYREHLKETHPDVSDDPDASARTKRLIEAKEVLTDETRRMRYDRLGHEQYVNGGDDLTAPSASSDRQTTQRETNRATTSDGETDPGGVWTGGESTQSGPHTSGRSPRDSWRDSGSATEQSGSSGTWRAWKSDTSYSVHPADEGLMTSRFFPSNQSVVLLASTFLLYPVLLGGAVAPQFPLVVNLVLGVCLLSVVAYLQSIPEVGIVVFGGWSLFLPVLLVSLGVSILSVFGAIALSATVLPLGLSVLTRAVVRS